MRQCIAVAILTTLAANTWAGIYVPGEKPPFAFSDDGTVKPLNLNDFQFLLGEARTGYVADPTPSEQHLRLLAQIEQLGGGARFDTPPEDVASLTAYQIRAGLFDQALNVLRDPLVRRFEPFFASSHLAWLQFLSGSYADARTSQFGARSDFPTEIEGYTDAQLAWYRRIERDILKNLFHGRASQPDHDGVDAIFGEMVQFVGPDGTYQPGPLPESQVGKLPPDAVAIVQQLVLWAPFDARLYWLLGEVYNAQGDVETAFKILDDCVYSRGYASQQLREHRRVLYEEVERRRAEASTRPDAEAWFPAGPVPWIVIGVASLAMIVLMFWQLRVLWRRMVRG